MNPTPILALIANLYEQLVAAQERVAALEQELARVGQSDA